ncbi:MAG TPA: sigma-70 family RNA polymerase sigma factor, partial [Steroidobacteraceae bacterium]
MHSLNDEYAQIERTASSETPDAGERAGRLVEWLARDYGRELMRFLARRIRPAADAQDLAQETYIRLIRLPRKDLIREPRRYLYRVALNVLFDHESRRKAEMSALEGLGNTNGCEQATEDNVEGAGLQRRLEAVMDELSPKCRAVLLLHRQAGMTYDEIASRLEISSSMVKKYLAKGLQHCRGRLQEWR